MLFKSHILEQIKIGAVTVAFRRWKKPTVRAGGRLRTPVGELAILKVEIIDPATITAAEASSAGFSNADAVRNELNKNTHTARTDPIYKITFKLAGPDSRDALRANDNLGETQLVDIKAKLARLDKASPTGAWTTQTLAIINHMPAQPARLLAGALGIPAARFKTNVRKLKDLGLTQSLGTGYKLSPRGEVVLKKVDKKIRDK